MPTYVLSEARQRNVLRVQATMALCAVTPEHLAMAPHFAIAAERELAKLNAEPETYSDETTLCRIRDANDYPKYSLLLTQELFDEEVEPACSLCGAPSSSMCAVCLADYCGRECQAAHWPEHKPMCGVSLQSMTILHTITDKRSTFQKLLTMAQKQLLHAFLDDALASCLTCLMYLHPDSKAATAQVTFWLGRVHHARGEILLARNCFTRYCAHCNSRPETRWRSALGTMYSLSTYKVHDYVDMFKRASAILLRHRFDAPLDCAECFVILGQASFALGNLPMARAAFAVIFTTIRTDSHRARYLLATALGGMGRWHFALGEKHKGVAYHAACRASLIKLLGRDHPILH